MSSMLPVQAETPSSLPLTGLEPFYDRGSEGVDVRAILDILLRGKWLILATVLALLIPVAAVSWTTPSRFRSYSILLIDKTDTDLSTVATEMSASRLFQKDKNLSNEMLVLDQSMPLAETVAARIIETGTVPGTGRPFTVLTGATADGEVTPQEVAFTLQRRYVDAAPEPGGADAIRVIVTSTDRDEAAFISNAFAEAFAQLTQDQSRAGAANSREFLEGQVQSQSERLSEADAAVSRYMLQEGAVALEEETSRLVDQIATLDARRDQATVNLQTKRAELAALQTELRRTEGQVGERLSSTLDAELTAARQRSAALRAQLETYYARTPSLRTNPNPPAEYAEVASLRRQLQEAEAAQIRIADALAEQALASGTSPDDQRSGFVRAAGLRDQISAARVQVRGLEAEVAQINRRLRQYEGELAAVPAQSIELAQLERERRAAEGVYGSLETNLQQARVAEQSQLGYARVIRPAFPASAPYTPLRGRNVLVALVCGLILGMMLAIGKVRLDHRINTPDDLAKLGRSVIGTVPSTTELVAEEFGGAETALVNGRQVDTHVVSLLNPLSTASESYRALRTNIQFSRPDVVVQTILVTSSNPGEGKSVTSSNLAVVFAQAGRRVLLVDADLRRPTVHKKLGLPREPGLVQQMFSEDRIDPAQIEQLADDLYVLPAGQLSPNPSELIGSKRMRDLIADMREVFDIVIFDAPPVLAATDAVLLSTQCDATLLIVRAGETKDYELESATTALADVGTQVSGYVLNAFDVRNAYGYRYKYAYRYGNAYGYGYETREDA
ncbi:GumC family protein [Rubrivirga sp. IMCC45206]|uniref:GumC family protein n=1 Tax=Rubrivirga sp. IMCC45206 TaxID=3391614 RepID=UPI00398FF8C7